jgi:hypothetical protein
MLGFELMEKLPRLADFSFFRAPPLADAFLHVGAGGNVEQALDHRTRFEAAVIVSYEK